MNEWGWERMKKILIVGAGFLQVPLIKKAKECGLYTIAVDGDQNAPGFFTQMSGNVLILQMKRNVWSMQKKKKLTASLLRQRIMVF